MLLHWSMFILQKMKSLILTNRFGSLAAGYRGHLVSHLLFPCEVSVPEDCGEPCSHVWNKTICGETSAAINVDSGTWGCPPAGHTRAEGHCRKMAMPQGPICWVSALMAILGAFLMRSWDFFTGLYCLYMHRSGMRNEACGRKSIDEGRWGWQISDIWQFILRARSHVS